MKNFIKKYQLWESRPFQECLSCSVKPGSPILCEACLERRSVSEYVFREFDTLQECIEAPKHYDWYITKKVSLAVTEAETEPTQLLVHKDLIPIVKQAAKLIEQKPDERTPEQIATDDLAASYAHGPVARTS